MSFYKQTTGYIVHQRNFKNNSLIIEFFSKDFGKIQMVAKGIKSNKRLISQYSLFSLAKIHFYGSSELKTLVSIDLLEQKEYNDLLLKTSALYLNELIHLNVIENDNCELLYEAYHQAINYLGKTKLFWVLRKFEWQLLKYNGFEISVDHLSPDQWLLMKENHELKVIDSDLGADCQVSDIQKFIKEKPLDKLGQKRINKFMEKTISICLSHRKIYSKELIKSLIKSV